MKKILFFIFSLAVFTGCDPKIDEFPASTNGLDFSNFVAVGNSMTAGFADNALYTSGQINSIPNIMAEQFKHVGGGEFRQPLIGTEDGVGMQPPPNVYFFPKLSLQILPEKDCQGNPTGAANLKPALVFNPVDQNALKQQLMAPPVQAGPYNNMGVPALTLQTAFFPGYGSALGNPFFARFASNPMATVLGDAAAQKPTFFMLWLGSNDVLLSALQGTDQMITPADTFAKYYPMAAGALLQSGNNPRGVLCNIPDITAIPYFTTISKSLPYNGVTLTEEQAAGLNILYGMYGHPEIVWKKGQNPFVYEKSDGSWAQMEAGDLFLLTLPTDSVKCKGMGIADQNALKPYPIPGKYVLDKGEQARLQEAVNQYNNIIRQTAATLNLAHADLNSYLKTLESGIIFDGIKLNTTFITGGVFSTDGVHLNPRGNAMAANYIIQAINAHYGSAVPQANITRYRGVVFP